MSESIAPVELPRSRSGQAALEVCETAARRAGELVLARFRTDVAVSLKGRANVVTDADLASERLILDYVTDEYPDFGVLSEESAPVAGASPYTWVVDPIDGTRNFAEGIPHFCIVVAIADGDAVVAGVTYDPVRDELFAAQQGAGAYLNGQRIQVSDRQNIEDAILGFDLGYDFGQAKHLMEMVAGIWPQISGYRLMGSSALSIAYTAAGRIDLYAHHSLSCMGHRLRHPVDAGSRRPSSGSRRSSRRYAVLARTDYRQRHADGAIPGHDRRLHLAHDVARAADGKF